MVIRGHQGQWSWGYSWYFTDSEHCCAVHSVEHHTAGEWQNHQGLRPSPAEKPLFTDSVPTGYSFTEVLTMQEPRSTFPVTGVWSGRCRR